MVNSATSRMADNLSNAILNQDDPQTVKDASPAYLIMIDSLIEGDPKNVTTLLSGSKLYSSFTSAFVKDEVRSKRLAEKSLSYARRALCIDLQSLCHSLDSRLDHLYPIINSVGKSDLAVLYTFASAWAGWIQVNSDDWGAIAQIPKLTALFEHSITLDQHYDDGGSHLYLGVLASQIPPSLGGKPEQAKAYFESADKLSEGKNLMVKLLYAEHYARLVFDQELHDQLLKSVLSAEVEAPGLTLINSLAQQRASVLLKESTDYF